MIHFINNGNTGIIATKKEIAFIIGESIVGPFPNNKSYMKKLIKCLKFAFENNKIDTTMLIELEKERQKISKANKEATKQD